MGFHIATAEQIKAGEVVDVYFRRSVDILEARGVDKRVRAEFVAKDLPENWEWAVFAGLEELLHLLEGLGVNVRSMEEGQVFRRLEPVLEIEGSYTAFAAMETASLGLICQASGIATRAARCRKAAGPNKRVISFGARRMHPALAPMIERAAYLGGCDGVAVVASAELLGTEAAGTIPHALVLVMGDTVAAAEAFDEVIDSSVPRIALIDTFTDEKLESLRIAEAMGDRLAAVRLDTPSSRRGDFYEILREVRWELDLRGHDDVGLFVSGGIGEEQIRRLNPLVDGYGVGGWISAAPVIDFSMDIVEIEGAPIAKRGKWSGAKQVLRFSDCNEDVIVPLHDAERWPNRSAGCGGPVEELLVPRMKDGALLEELPSPAEIREKTLMRIDGFDIEWKE